MTGLTASINWLLIFSFLILKHCSDFLTLKFWLDSPSLILLSLCSSVNSMSYMLMRSISSALSAVLLMTEIYRFSTIYYFLCIFRLLS